MCPLPLLLPLLCSLLPSLLSSLLLIGLLLLPRLDIPTHRLKEERRGDAMAKKQEHEELTAEWNKQANMKAKTVPLD